MNFKALLNMVLMLLLKPALAWKAIAHSKSKAPMLNKFLYPMIMLCCISTFVGTLFAHEFSGENFYSAIVKMGLEFARIFFAYYLLSFLVAKLPRLMLNSDCSRLTTDLLAGFSMVVVLLLDISLGLFPNFRIIAWILQFYTFKVVWDGAAVLLRVPEEQRLGITAAVSLLVLVVPFVVGYAMLLLSVNFG